MNPYLLDKVQVHYSKNRRQGSAGRQSPAQKTTEGTEMKEYVIYYKNQETKWPIFKANTEEAEEK